MRTQRTTAQSSYLLDAIVDGDRAPMPNEGMAAIARICSESSRMAFAMAQAPRTSLPLVVNGVNAPQAGAAPRVSAENAKALEALGGALGRLASDDKKESAKPSEASPETPPPPVVSQPESRPVGATSPASATAVASRTPSTTRRTQSAERAPSTDMALSDEFPDQTFDMVLSDEDPQAATAPTTEPSTSAPTPAPTDQP